MVVKHLPEHQEIVSVDIASFLPCKFNDKYETSRQIAAHLRHMLETFGSGEQLSLKTPSAMTLSGFYNRSILDVLDALFALKKQHYEYIIQGLDGEIILYAPVVKKKLLKDFSRVHDIIAPWGRTLKRKAVY
jgi:hypothetical protein